MRLVHLLLYWACVLSLAAVYVPSALLDARIGTWLASAMNWNEERSW